MTAPRDKAAVLVVGGGVQGLACAVELARDGHAVQLLERERPGSRASWVAAGLLTPSSPWRYPRPLIELAFASEAMYPAFVADLAEHTGIDAQLDTAGMLYPVGVGCAREEIEVFTERRRALGFEVEMLERAALDRLQPGLGPAVTAAGWQAVSSRVRPPRLLRALIARAEALDVAIQYPCDATSLEVTAGRVTGVSTAAGQRFDADVVVLAAGAWSTRLAATAGVTLSVMPVRGQILLLRGPAGLLVPTINDGNGYLVPRSDGRLLVGSTMEDAGFDAVTTPAALERLRESAARLFPATRQMEVETDWAGLRPGTPDRMPYLGPVASRPGLLLACGHFRNGILLAPITGRIVADLVAGRPPGLDIEPFSASRAASDQGIGQVCA